MKKWVFAGILAGIFFFTVVAFISWQVSFPLLLPSQEIKSKFYDYAGITHVHSNLSTGSGTYSEIVRSAYKADCEFVILTDLNPGHKIDNVEGYRDDVLVARAGEYSFLGGHVLAYNLSDISKMKGLGQLQIFFNDLLEKKPRPPQDGFLVAAHPFLPKHSWEDLNQPGLSGMEIINLDSVWHTRLNGNKVNLLWSFLLLPFNADLAFLRLYTEPSRELGSWDELLQKRMFTGFGGNDSTANAIPIPDKSFHFPSYIRSFRLLKNHVLLKSELTGTYAEDRAKIVDALARGSFYFSIDLIGNPVGFYFIAQQKRQEYLSGTTLTLNNGAITLVADLGRDIGLEHEIILYKNGQKIAANSGSRLTYDARSPGAYRIQVKVSPTLPIPDGKTTMTWIFSNPIRIE